MILLHKNLVIQKDNIQFKKRKQSSNDFVFIPIQYNGEDVLIQTPHCFVPFGLNQYSTFSNKKYLDISFQESHSDFIKNCFDIFYQKVMDQYASKYQVESFLKENPYSKCTVRFKVDNDCLFFDQYKRKIDSFRPKIFGVFIIHLSGLWLMNNKIWFNWNILQAKVTIPPTLKEYSFIDEKIKIPPPPPPPPPPLNKYQKMKKLGVPINAIHQQQKNDRINVSDLKNVVLKKTKENKKLKKDGYMPSLDEIRNALQSLQKLN